MGRPPTLQGWGTKERNNVWGLDWRGHADSGLHIGGTKRFVRQKKNLKVNK